MELRGSAAVFFKIDSLRRIAIGPFFEEVSMAQQTPSGVVRQASTLSILWGVSLIILGMLAVGSPFVAAVAENVIIAWLVVLAGVVLLTLAFHTRESVSLIWRLLLGHAYVCCGVYLIARPAVG